MSRSVRARLATAVLVFVCSVCSSAAAEPIDLPTALARARERAPEAIAALARIGEARAQRTGAAVRLTENPELQLAAGRRYGAPRTLAIQGQLTQPLEIGRRAPRIAVANAGIAHAQALAEAELRELAYRVELAFDDARHADLVVELARRSAEVAASATEAADRRRKAGDVTDLDVHLAHIALGRARAALAAAEAERANATGKLAVLIGAAPEEPLSLAGDLRPPTLSIETLRTAVAARADVRAFDAEARHARGELALATASGRPDVGLFVGYQVDETDAILLGGVTLTLPLWNRAQGGAAVARAKQRRAELERGAVANAAARQVADAFAAYTRAREAAGVFERDVLPRLADSEALLQRTIESGQIAIHDYLVARQQLLDGRREHLDRRLQLAKAAAAARFAAGVSP